MAATLVSTWSYFITRTYIHGRLESDFTDLLNGRQSKLQVNYTWKLPALLSFV